MGLQPIGAKKTLIAGLILIVVFSAAAGASPSINGIIGFRALGVGNALFIATSLAVIVASASGGFAGAIVPETALGSASRSARCSAGRWARSAGGARSTGWPR